MLLVVLEHIYDFGVIHEKSLLGSNLHEVRSSKGGKVVGWFGGHTRSRVKAPNATTSDNGRPEHAAMRNKQIKSNQPESKIYGILRQLTMAYLVSCI